MSEFIRRPFGFSLVMEDQGEVCCSMPHVTFRLHENRIVSAEEFAQEVVLRLESLGIHPRFDGKIGPRRNFYLKTSDYDILRNQELLWVVGDSQGNFPTIVPTQISIFGTPVYGQLSNQGEDSYYLLIIPSSLPEIFQQLDKVLHAQFGVSLEHLGDVRWKISFPTSLDCIGGKHPLKSIGFQLDRPLSSEFLSAFQSSLKTLFSGNIVFACSL